MRHDELRPLRYVGGFHHGTVQRRGAALTIRKRPERNTTRRTKDWEMLIEIRAGEGGNDAALFTTELAQAYIRHLDAIG